MTIVFWVRRVSNKPCPKGALLHCSVCQRPEVGEDLWRLRGIHHSLREEDADHCFLRIVVGGCAEAAGPAVAAWSMEDLSSLNVHRYSETPTGIIPEKNFGACALLRGELVGGHQLNRGAGENLFVTVLAFVEHHAAESEIVVDGGDESTCARFKRRRAKPCAVRRVVKYVQPVRLAIEETARGQAVEFLGGT